MSSEREDAPSEPGGLSLRRAGRDKAPGARCVRDAQLAPNYGHAGNARRILMLHGVFLGKGKAGNAQQRIGLNLEPFVGNVLAAAAAPTIVAGTNQLQRAFDAAEFGNRPDLRQHDQTFLPIDRCLVGGIGTGLELCISL
jgi:hypothetical protein